MPRSAHVYIMAVIVMGALSVAAAAARPWGADPVRVACYVLLALAGATLKLRLPGIHGNISLSFVFVLIGVAALSLPATVLIGCAATAVQCLWRPRSRPLVRQVLFNVAAVGISASVAYQGPRMVLPGAGPDHLTPVLMIASMLYFMTNTLLVSLVLALANHRPVRVVWLQCHLWSFPYYVVGALVAALVAASDRLVGWRPATAMLPAMYLVFLMYQQVLDRFGPASSATRVGQAG